MDEASKNIVSHPTHEDPQLFVVGGPRISTGAQSQDIFHKGGDALVGTLGFGPK